ncbi:MAG: hypothetical protein FWD23_06225 [Oscillospiraceae bacterium]|nr:hypothetical protein [Oscillospiraceae bacterium]
MTELEKIKRAKMYIEKLANGLDPIKDIELPDDNILNNERLSRCFSYVADILRQVAENGGIGYVAKKPFEITEQQKRQIVFSDTPIPISAVCDNISGSIDLAVYRRLSHNKVTEWLVEKGFLKEIAAEKGTRKTLTDKSPIIGITQEDRISPQYGTQYTMNLYSREAQQFIVDHLDEIMPKSNEKSETDE